MQGSALMTINFHDNAATFSIDKNKELMLFRITQELLNNAIKHAQATEIKVNLVADRALALTVEDDGVGFNIDEQKSDKRLGKGLGLYSIENRASLLGAKLDFDKLRRKGSKITLTLPLTS
jgi:two-component system NarL family sensor kinase